MKHIKKWSLGALVIALLLSCTTLTAQHSPAAAALTDATVQSYEQQLAEISIKQQQALNKLSDIRDDLSDAQATKQAYDELQEVLIRKAADTLEFAPSEEQIQAEMDEQMQNLNAQLAQQGVNLQMYCQFMNTTEEQLRADTRNNAIASVRVQAAIEQIVTLENLEATQEDIGEAVAVIARQNRMTVEQLKPYYDAEFEKAVVRSVLSTKATKLIRDAAILTETA